MTKRPDIPPTDTLACELIQQLSAMPQRLPIKVYNLAGERVDIVVRVRSDCILLEPK